MTESHHHDKHLDEHLRGKSAVSNLYQKLHADEPASQTDAAILAAARHTARSKSRRAGWMIPAAIAAILIIGISLVWWRQYQTPTPIDIQESAAPTQPGSLLQQIDRSLHDNPAADQWLERILKLHTDGKTGQAAAEFKKFRRAFPAYSLDPQRFGELQQYDK